MDSFNADLLELLIKAISTSSSSDNRKKDDPVQKYRRYLKNDLKIRIVDWSDIGERVANRLIKA